MSNELIITDAKSLGKALKTNEDTITIEGDLRKKVIRIKATGKIAWAIALGAIGAAVYLVLSAPATGGVSGAVGLTALAPAVTIMGGGAASAAVMIAVGAGGVGALNSLRKYKIIKNSDTQITLKRN
jgi:hypothetical protein